MPDIGSLDNAINSEMVILKQGADELAVIYNQTDTVDTPQSRAVVRGGIAIDFDGVQRREISFTTLVTKAVNDKFITWRTKNAATSQLPYNDFTVEGTSIANTAGTKYTSAFSAKVINYTYTAAEQGGFIANVRLLVKAY